jgi:hypothetical protein
MPPFTTQPSFASTGYTPDRLIAGGPIKTGTGVLITGQNLARGALLGKITASGKLTLSLSAAGDGSQVPFAILAEDTDATGADTANVGIYLAGEFNEDRIVYGAAHTKDTVRDGLRDLGIFLKDPVPA